MQRKPNDEILYVDFTHDHLVMKEALRTNTEIYEYGYIRRVKAE